MNFGIKKVQNGQPTLPDEPFQEEAAIELLNLEDLKGIVGQGIEGSRCVWQCTERKQTILVCIIKRQYLVYDVQRDLNIAIFRTEGEAVVSAQSYLKGLMVKTAETQE